MQRFDGIHPRGFVRRVEAEEDAHGEREEESHGDRLRRDDRGPADEAGQESRAGNAEYHAGHSADRRQDDRFHQKLQQDVGAFGADGHADADFPGSLRHRDQ